MKLGTCPLCEGDVGPDGRPEAEIAGLMFRSRTCDQPPTGLLGHPFPVRWLEAEASSADEIQEFRERFVLVRGPLPPGTPISEAFGEIDPIRAWIEDHPLEGGGYRVLIRL